MITLTIVLNGEGGELDRTEVNFDRDITATPAARVANDRAIQTRILTAIASWSLRPGDAIEIRGNEEAFDTL